MTLFYVLAAAVLASILLTVWTAALLRKDDAGGSPWTRRLVRVLQLAAFVLYSLAWVSILDYVAFMFTCKWSAVRTFPHHMHWPEQSKRFFVCFLCVCGFLGGFLEWGKKSTARHNKNNNNNQQQPTTTKKGCLAMPHLAHMAFALAVALAFMFMTLCLVRRCAVLCCAALRCVLCYRRRCTLRVLIAPPPSHTLQTPNKTHTKNSKSMSDCDLNPMTRNILASPAPETNFKVLALKMAMVIMSACLAELVHVQPALLVACVSLIAWLVFSTVRCCCVLLLLLLLLWVRARVLDYVCVCALRCWFVGEKRDVSDQQASNAKSAHAHLNTTCPLYTHTHTRTRAPHKQQQTPNNPPPTKTKTKTPKQDAVLQPAHQPPLDRPVERRAVHGGAAVRDRVQRRAVRRRRVPRAPDLGE